MAELRKKKLPIGIENFEKLRTEDFYYADKTGLISELLHDWGEVNLFTRPRRFGKTLNMSMLRYFFDPEGDKGIFDGLRITGETKLCGDYMGKYPVIFISLKGIQAMDYETAARMAAAAISMEAGRRSYLLKSDRLTASEKEDYRKLLDRYMDEATLFSSLRTLSGLLEKHHGSKIILLIDEYDVPLAKAYAAGYYERMLTLVRALFEQGLKTNDSLKLAVLTGCMRVSKESVFTGLNNLKVFSLSDVRCDEYFGFTDGEVRALLDYYELSDSYEKIREWYDGYRFGAEDVYCPWDVLNYCDLLRADPEAGPQNYWSHTSSNDVVRELIRRAPGTTRREIEQLVAGETILKEIRQDLTYSEMYRSADHLWSVLFMTGYLTQRGKPEGEKFRLAIPNREIRSIFTTQIMEYFREGVQKDGETLNRFCGALSEGRPDEAEKLLAGYLRRTISIRDTAAREGKKENFFHGILLGILGFKEDWIVLSNRESGDGYGDILVEIEEQALGIILEVKYSADGNLEDGCRTALRQIEERRYEEQLRDDGMERILKYGVACCKKQCRIQMALAKCCAL